jgi:diguanylate cyclase (GGDEF)-like protein
VRASDIGCRLGGSEFLVICPSSSRMNAAAVAEAILSEQQPFRTSDGVECWNGAVSIGIAEADSTIEGPEDLRRAAGQALYAAKRQGGACMAFSQES